MEGEVPAKKARIEEMDQKNVKDEEKKPIQAQAKSRILKLDISKYKPRIQNMTDEELLQIFDIGVAVKESLTLTVSENNSFVREQLESQMKPVHEKMAELASSVEKSMGTINKSVDNGLEETKTEMLKKMQDMKTEVFEFSKKVQPVGEMERRISTTISNSAQNIVTKIDGLSKEFQKPAKKGIKAENNVMSTLKENLPQYTFKDVSKEKGKGDIRVSSPEGYNFMVEVKSRQDNVPKKDIEKFKKDVLTDKEVKVGVMLSEQSAIAMKCKNGKFEVNYIEGKYLIYVPGILVQREVMVWSICLANELSRLNVELQESQANKLRTLCESFHEKVKQAKKCQDDLINLKKAMDALEQSIEPIFEIIKNANKELKAILL